MFSQTLLRNLRCLLRSGPNLAALDAQSILEMKCHYANVMSTILEYFKSDVNAPFGSQAVANAWILSGRTRKSNRLLAAGTDSACRLGIANCVH